MKFKLPRIKIFQLLFSLKYFYFIIILLIVGFSITLGLFLYKNFYQTITQSKEIILLRKEVAPDSLNLEKVEKIIELLERKTTTTEMINFEKIKDPFMFIESRQPTLPTTTSSL